MFKGDLSEGLPRFFWLFVAAFVLFIAVVAGVTQFWGDRTAVSLAFVAVTLLVCAVLGLLSATGEASGWFVAGRQVPSVFNGMSKAAGWVSGPVFIGLAGGLAFSGQAWLALLVGWSGGLVLIAVLLAPYLRKTGAYTVPEFLFMRYGGGPTRLVALAILVVVAFTMTMAQLSVLGLVAERLLDLPYLAGVWVGLLAVLLATAPGGMRSASWTQPALYVVLALAFLAPLVWVSVTQGHGFLPQFAYAAFERAAELERATGPVSQIDPAPLDSAGEGGGAFGAWRFMALTICLMAGVAAMPHMLVRAFASRTARGAGRSVAWALLFALVVTLSAPALATMMKLALIDPELPGALVGKSLQQVAAMEWTARWSELGALRLQDVNGDGMLQAGEIALSPGMATLGGPEIAGLPIVLSGLAAAGAVAAAVSTAQISLLALAGALGHDLHHATMNPDADMPRRMAVVRGLMVVIGALAAWLAMQRVADPLATLAWAAGFAASGLFFPLVLGVWWKRATQAGAIAGMVFGFAAGAVYAWLVHAGGMEPWLGLDSLRFGVVGLAASALAMVAVSLLTPAPDGAARLMVEDIRRPYGPALLPRTH